MDNGVVAGSRIWDGFMLFVIVNNVLGMWLYDIVNCCFCEDIFGRVFRDNVIVFTFGSDVEIKLRRFEVEFFTALMSVIEYIILDGGFDIEMWCEIFDLWIGMMWLDVFWFLVEFYFYRRILNVIGYFDLEFKFFNFDLFLVDKMNGLCVGV